MENSQTNTTRETHIENSQIHAKYSAIGDIHIHREKDQPSFSKPNLNAYSAAHYIQPTFTTTAFEKLVRGKILIVAGGTGFDKSSFIRHLASSLVKNSEDLTPRELIQNEEKLSLFSSLAAFDSPSVFIIDEAHPRIFDHNLKRFLSIAEKGHYILVTTDSTVDTWDTLEAFADKCWFNIPNEPHYEPSVLADFTERQFDRVQDKLSDSVRHMLLTESSAQNISILKLARRFSSPEQILMFLHLLSDGENYTEEKLDELITSVTSSGSGLSIWFKNLSQKEQLVALGMALLDGMYDDQFFSCMQEFVAEFWQHRDPQLLSLDYCDIDFILPFFALEDINEEKRLIRSRNSAQHLEIIAVAWNNYKRHILVTLPLLKQSVVDTVNPKESNWEKYGTRERRMTLRQAIGDTLSNIGLLSFHMVETIFLELASYQNIIIQRVAAKAMARWRELEHDDLYFNTVFNWQTDDRIHSLMSSIRYNSKDNQPDGTSKDNSVSYIKATIALSLSYAANYDSPNDLDERFIEALRTITKDQDPLAISRLSESLPRIIQHHSRQLIDVLEEFTVIDDLQIPIAIGLQRAYDYYPEMVRETLYNWFDSAADSTSQDNRRQKLTLRDKLIVTVLETFQRIPYHNDGSDIISLDDVFNRLAILIRQEKRSSLVKVINHTAGTLIGQNFEIGKKYFTTLYDLSVEENRKTLSDLLLVIYFEQRKLQETDSEYKIEIGENTIPAWMNLSNRTITPVEKLMIEWIDDSNLEIKKMGSSAFIRFIDQLDHVEQLTIEEMKRELLRQRMEREERKREQQRKAADQAKQLLANLNFTPSFYQQFTLWKRIHVFLFLLFKPRQQRIVFKELFKSILTNPSYHPEYKHAYLWKLKMSSNPLTIKMAEWCQKFLD
ncbi:hypothetical protein [Phaeocystidibacter marisrubri]|uniref:Uncharacterized protein n=1 Tax=Phaeocystidibacter marisrubri TaxID=1577780 RepID=A0A6L3ZHK9_9FLAO|nr:hypothetical protein [Phaeocystidibacter marisrubri]KAB2817078.1 hypothetical protein F8C82_01390 [Phaeocystidibacter marisrubri]GGH76951.1 hypothetical protein GCM10011318_25990 [Phaeocystidibacter marisrubri]